MRIDILTIFPRMFAGVLGESILRIAAEKGIVEYHLTDIRDYTTDRHRSVDDRPYGGGPGMVMKVEPVVRAVRDVRARASPEGRLILLTPQGETFRQARARELAREKRLILIAGHYEGFDERILEILKPEEISIGDYILTGGEIPAMAVVDAVVRLIPGVLGSDESAGSESFSSGLLEYPQYTRPAEFEGHAVPEVLLSGDHEEIRRWRLEQAEKRTKTRRPDLWRSRAGGKEAKGYDDEPSAGA
ncbi:MAG: tRNA (guanosine(37)-N1)-methyltransferase TrmD [Planctomycetota bacterium]|nr:tRNA (guanosine(37)-N1)-methyltransferase TrmD [Planctomycetota bacterium]